MEKKTHWENVFATKTAMEVSWYQQCPQTSIDFISELNVPFDAKIIDIGGGDSYFIDALLALGYTNLYLLDISSNAIERVKLRLGENQSKVTFIVADILDFNPEIRFDVWHDRACFHFLVTPEDIRDYRRIVTNALVESGKMILGTFSENGPLKCSGLVISQYTSGSMQAVFNVDFDVITTKLLEHKTPFDTIQNFVFCSFIKK